jgi:hypothetical protein
MAASQDASSSKRAAPQARSASAPSRINLFFFSLEHAFAKVTGSAPSAPAIAAPPSRRRPEHVPFDADGG